MNRISDLTRRLWAALLALCLVLALTLPVFAEGESETADTAEKETFHIGTVDDLLQLADSCRLDSWSKNRTVYLDADLELTGSGFAGIPSCAATCPARCGTAWPRCCTPSTPIWPTRPHTMTWCSSRTPQACTPTP